MIESKYYTCNFCQNEFIPTRRKAQKYCSSTCRSKAFYHQKKINEQLKPQTNFPEKVSNELDNNVKQAKTKVEQISAAGVGNAALGTLAADGLKSLVTKPENKPLTKGDIKMLVSQINGRYHLINNMPKNNIGQSPYFDLEKGEVVFRYG